MKATELELRVTHAICESGLGRFSCGFDGTLACYCGRKDAYLVAARAAIKAMHEDSVPIPVGLPRQNK